MKIVATWDDSALLLRLRNGQKRLADATVNAINATAKAIQQAEFKNVREKFHIRMPAFFFGTDARVGGVAARITKFANVGRGVAYAEVSTGKAAVGARRGVLLPMFEEGGVKVPLPGRKSVAVPITGGARSSISQPISPEFTFPAMRLTAFANGRKVRRPGRRRSIERGYDSSSGISSVPGFELRGVVWRGTNNTFYLPHTRRFERGAVFQRTGPGRADIRILWKFQGAVAIQPTLRFRAVANETWHRLYREHFTREVLAALARNRYNLAPAA